MDVNVYHCLLKQVTSLEWLLSEKWNMIWKDN